MHKKFIASLLAVAIASTTACAQLGISKEQAGTVIGDNDGEAVVTPYDDCVLVMPSVRQALAGVTVVRFARSALL